MYVLEGEERGLTRNIRPLDVATSQRGLLAWFFVHRGFQSFTFTPSKASLCRRTSRRTITLTPTGSQVLRFCSMRAQAVGVMWTDRI